MRPLRLVLLAAAPSAGAAGAASAEASAARGGAGAAAKARCHGTRAVIGTKRTCLHPGRRCRPGHRADYRLAGYRCVRRRLHHHRRHVLRRLLLQARRQGRALELPTSGRPSFRQALWWFDATVHPLRGVRTPRGAVSTEDQDGTAAIKSLDLYRKRLSRAQRRTLDHVLTPRPARSAAAPPIGDLRTILADAVPRLRAHGITFIHPVSVDTVAQGEPHELAYTVAQWLYGQGSTCAISYPPRGAGRGLAERRRVMIHELMHCAAAEQAGSRAAYDRQPKFLDEGLPEWASYKVSLEWQGTVGSASWWPTYLDNPESDLFKRAYDAVGFWSLVDHEGVDPFALQPTLVHIGASGDPRIVLDAVRAAAPGTMPADWGSTLATKGDLGARWNLDGPGMPTRHEPQHTIDDGDARGRVVLAHGAWETGLDLKADVLRLRAPDGGDGWLRDSAGNDHRLDADTMYCMRDGGCTCPDGHTPTAEDIPPGLARLGFANASTSSPVLAEGESLDKACGPKSPGGLEVHREIGDQDQLVATFTKGTCTRKKKLFTARATDGAYSLKIRISGFTGYNRSYPLAYGQADPGFVLDGPGGPWSTAFTPPVVLPAFGPITFNRSGTVLSMAFPAVDRHGGPGALVAGLLRCTKK